MVDRARKSDLEHLSDELEGRGYECEELGAWEGNRVSCVHPEYGEISLNPR